MSRAAPQPADGRIAVAAFDFDGTLTKGGSVWPFLVRVRGVWRTMIAGISIAPTLAVAAFVGGRFADGAKESLFRRTLGGLDAQELARVAAEFGPRHLSAERRPDVLARLDQHRRQGHRIVIVSASPELYVAAAAAEIGVDGVLATRLAVGPDGKLTGGYDGGNCRGEEKLRRLRQWVDEHAPGAELWAYGNSAGDQRMLAGATVGIDVGRLGPVGRLRAFRRLRDTAELIGA